MSLKGNHIMLKQNNRNEEQKMQHQIKKPTKK